MSDGHGVFLTTEKEYGDFDLYVDWNLAPNGDSGIYLRGCPQVQIWDPENADQFQHGNQKGSGALWNNNDDNPGKWPLSKADRPCHQGNTFRHSNDRLTRLGLAEWGKDRRRCDHGQLLRSQCTHVCQKA